VDLLLSIDFQLVQAEYKENLALEKETGEIAKGRGYTIKGL
jgi:hypothetical protein